MTRTVWAGFRLPQARRVVIHTFGSDMDTVLAVYRGNTLNKLTRVAATTTAR